MSWCRNISYLSIASAKNQHLTPSFKFFHVPSVILRKRISLQLYISYQLLPNTVSDALITAPQSHVDFVSLALNTRLFLNAAYFTLYYYLCIYLTFDYGLLKTWLVPLTIYIFHLNYSEKIKLKCIHYTPMEWADANIDR